MDPIPQVYVPLVPPAPHEIALPGGRSLLSLIITLQTLPMYGHLGPHNRLALPLILWIEKAEEHTRTIHWFPAPDWLSQQHAVVLFWHIQTLSPSLPATSQRWTASLPPSLHHACETPSPSLPAYPTQYRCSSLSPHSQANPTPMSLPRDHPVD